MIIITIGATNVVCAQEFKKATKAYDAADYTTPRKIFNVLAEPGNATAQTHRPEKLNGS